MEDIFLEINRYGFIEETHFTIAYSPVPDESVADGIGGVLATVHEITEKVRNERRLALLQKLGARSTYAKSAVDACASAAQILLNAKDVPFSLFYLIDEERKTARLAAASGIGEGLDASPITIELAGADPWGAFNALEEDKLQIVQNIRSAFQHLPSGPWPEPPNSAAVIPIRSNVSRQPAGVLIGGISPRQQFDEQYSSFFELLATQVATAIANARQLL